MPNPIVPATAGGMSGVMHVGGLLVDNTPSLLIDVYRALPQEDRSDFREVASDFSYGLNATIEGAHRAMKLWVRNPPSWLSERRQQQRRRFLETLDRFVRTDDLEASLRLRRPHRTASQKWR